MTHKHLLITLLAVATGLSACGSDDPAGTIASAEIDATYGGFLSSESENDLPDITVSFPPGAFAQNAATEIQITEAQVEGVEGVVSPVFKLVSDTPLLQPVVVTLVNPDAELTWALATIVNGQATPIADSALDPIRGELSATIPTAGEFAIVDAGALSLDPNAHSQTVGATAVEAASGGFFTQAERAADPAIELQGSWQGQGDFAGFEFHVDGNQFDIQLDGQSIRQGQLALSGNAISLTDASGNVESGTIEINQDAWLLVTPQSGTIEWGRTVNNTPPNQGGFFQPTDTTSQVSSGASGQVTQSTPASTSQASAQQSSSTPKQKGFFGRMGDRIKNVGGNVVSRVKNMGKTAAQRAEASAEQQVAAAEHAVDRKITQGENMAANEVDQLGNKMTNEIDRGFDSAFDSVGLDAGAAGRAPGNPCGSIGAGALREALGEYSQRQVSNSVCQVFSAAGSVDVYFEWQGRRQRIGEYQAMRRNGTCGAPNNVGNDSCLYQTGNGVRLMFSQGQVDVTVSAKLGNQSSLHAERIARSIVANI